MPRWQLVFVHAAHSPPLILRRGGITELYTECTFPVGLIPEANFTAATVNLNPSHTLILYSDGVTEAMEPEARLSGVTRLQEVLSRKHNVPLQELQNAILETVQAFTRDAS